MTAYLAHVFDLDGVVRDFGPGDVGPGIELALGLPVGHVAATAFRSDLIRATITGRQSFDQWYVAICDALEEVASRPERVREQMEAWRGHRGEAVEETVAHLEALRSAGQRTYVFTNGTDLVPHELEQLGLGHLFDCVINSADLGVAKPDAAAYAAAHRSIEADLGHPVARAAVWFTDDRDENVAAAREFGWDAALFVR